MDLATAGVPDKVDGTNGPEYADFHALRHTFCSALAAAETGAKELQTLARHSDPRLTLGLYTHARPAELAKAIGRLRMPTMGPDQNPLGAMGREDLESLTLGLLVAVGIILGSSRDTPRDTPMAWSWGEGSGVARSGAGGV